MDLSQLEHYARLDKWLAERSADVMVMYLATAPDLFPVICAQLGAARLNGPKVRVVLEKPPGHDLASAREINRVGRPVFGEQRPHAITPYLGNLAATNPMAVPSPDA